MNIAVIFAGGVGSRMRSKDKPKQFLLLHGVPIIIHTLKHFEQHNEIDAIVISCIGEWIPFLEDQIKRFGIEKVKSIVPGGASGQESIYNGLKAAEIVAEGEPAVVLIHDGVRPIINEKLISDNINCVIKNGSAITTVPAKETVISLNDDYESVDFIPNRDKLRIARAPQSFWLSDILELHERAIEEKKFDFIDSCTMMNYYKKNIYMVDGPMENIKVTTPDDFYTMRALLDAKENAQIYGFE